MGGDVLFLIAKMSEDSVNNFLILDTGNDPDRTHCSVGCKRGPYPGVETREQPDKPDALDTGDVVEGLG